MLEQALLLLLLMGWAAVLLPGALRSRNRSTHATVGGFERAMSVLRNRPDGREIMVPLDADRIVRGSARDPDVSVQRTRVRRDSPLIARRRALFVRMLGITSAAFALAVIFGGFLWPVFLMSGALLGGYSALLRHFKLERDEAREVVRRIDLPAYEEPRREERQPVAVGAGAPVAGDRYSGLQVATRPDEPWEPQTSVRIRRWDT